MNDASIIGLDPVHQEMDPIDARGVARINPPSGVGNNSNPLDVCNDISSCEEQVKANNLVSDVGCDSDSLDVCDDISSRTEQNKVEGLVNLEDDNFPGTVMGTAFLERRQCSHMVTARRDASTSPCNDGSERLHALVNGVTSIVDGKVPRGTSITECSVRARRDVYG